MCNLRIGLFKLGKRLVDRFESLLGLMIFDCLVRLSRVLLSYGGIIMCLDGCPLGGIAHGYWENAAVVFDTVLPAHRVVIGSKRTYSIDIREFVVTENNALLARTIHDDLLPFANTLDKRGAERFRERGLGSYDFRARVIVGWVLKNVRYVAKKGNDPWQFSAETLAIRSGDCEDIAFLVASLLLASGVSGYHVRLALGEVEDVRGNRFDHAWVLYKSEAGTWRLVEPLVKRHAELSAGGPRKASKPQKRPPRAAPSHYAGGLFYRAWYLLNADHLWAVPQHNHPGSLAAVVRRRWSRMNPKFAGEAHKQIVESALADVASPELMGYLRGRFKNLIVATVDESDWVNPLAPSTTPYNPLDHFDNGCVDESWDLVQRRLGTFADSKRQNFEAFAQAIHGIADFYAHSSYLHFALRDGSQVNRGATPYPGRRALEQNPEKYFHDNPSYGSEDSPGVVNMDLHRFSKNTKLWRGSIDDAIAHWDNRLISGRYAQDASDALGSTVDSIIEKLNTLPAKWRQPERGALPHHDEMAIDGPDRSQAHQLYDAASYRSQYERRMATAVRHVRQAFLDGTAY
jgi:hypothetical protein